MAIRKSTSAKTPVAPKIAEVRPEAAITGGELYIRGKGFAAGQNMERPYVTIGEVQAPVVIGSNSLVIVKVPEGASAGELIVAQGGQSSDIWNCDIGISIAENLHPITNPAVDSLGNVYTTFSGSRGQK